MTTHLLPADLPIPCATHPDTGLWLSDDPTRQAEAATICHACPARERCLTFGIETAATGTYGGIHLTRGRHLDEADDPPTCAVCHAPFVPSAGPGRKQTICSDTCRAERRRQLQRRNHARRRDHKQPRPTHTTCVICDQPIPDSRPSRVIAITCSPECGRQRKIARQRAYREQAKEAA